LDMNIENLDPIEREKILKELLESTKPSKKNQTIIHNDQERFDIYPLSDVQKSYWVENKGVLKFNRRLSNIYVCLNFDKTGFIFPKILKVRLEKSVNLLIQNHDILRTKIVKEFKQQTSNEKLKFRVELKKYSKILRNENILESQKQSLINNHINYGEWPLLKIIVTQWKDSTNVQMSISPLLMDGDGVALFLTQLFQNALGFRHKRVYDNGLTYRDYVVHYEKQKGTTDYLNAKEKKIARLENLPPAPNLPLKDRRSIRKFENQRFKIDKFTLLTAQEWEEFQELIAKKKVTVPAVLLTMFADAVSKWVASPRYYLGMINTYHLPELESANVSILGNFNTVDFIEFDSGIATFYERVLDISKQFAFNYDNGRYSGFEEIRKLRVDRQLGAEVTFPVGFNCTVNIAHPSQDDVLKPNNILMKFGEKYLPSLKMEELNIYTTQFPFIPTIERGDSGELNCKFARYLEYFQDGVLEDILGSFKQNIKLILNDENYWCYSTKETFKNIASSNFVEPESQYYRKEILNKIKKIHFDIVGFKPENLENLYFFGMYSIQILRFCSEINKEFDESFTPDDLLLFAETVNDLVEYIAYKKGVNNG